MHFLRLALSDETGTPDIAYVVVALLACAAVASITFLAVMSVVRVGYDPLPLGQAVGLVFGGFATLLASLSAYMAATRRNNKPYGT